LQKLKATENTETIGLNEIISKVYEAMNDDLNTPIAIAKLFDAVKIINSLNDNKFEIGKKELEGFQAFYPAFLNEILGLTEIQTHTETNENEATEELMNLVLELRQNARKNKDFATSDKIRDELKSMNIEIKDTADGAKWGKIK
jgi:cysteinyl-tRNA synthetase